MLPPLCVAGSFYSNFPNPHSPWLSKQEAVLFLSLSIHLNIFSMIRKQFLHSCDAEDVDNSLNLTMAYHCGYVLINKI